MQGKDRLDMETRLYHAVSMIDLALDAFARCEEDPARSAEDQAEFETLHAARASVQACISSSMRLRGLKVSS